MSISRSARKTVSPAAPVSSIMILSCLAAFSFASCSRFACAIYSAQAFYQELIVQQFFRLEGILVDLPELILLVQPELAFLQGGSFFLFIAGVILTFIIEQSMSYLFGVIREVCPCKHRFKVGLYFS